MTKCPRHFGTGAEVSIGHFGTNAKIWDASAPNTWCPNVLGPKCLRSEVSVHPMNMWYAPSKHGNFSASEVTTLWRYINQFIIILLLLHFFCATVYIYFLILKPWTKLLDGSYHDTSVNKHGRRSELWFSGFFPRFGGVRLEVDMLPAYEESRLNCYWCQQRSGRLAGSRKLHGRLDEAEVVKFTEVGHRARAYRGDGGARTLPSAASNAPSPPRQST